MILESSKDYGTGVVTMLFDGERPSYDEVRAYCYEHYGFKPFGYTTTMPSEYRGLLNPGTILCAINNEE